MDASSPNSRMRFGKFEVNLRSGELRKQGHRIRIQPQPMKVLAVLLERPGELVTRDELRKRLWPGELYVDFEHGLNRSINKLRRALLDDASSPIYIETLSTRGYRFIAPVEPDPSFSGPGSDVVSPDVTDHSPSVFADSVAAKLTSSEPVAITVVNAVNSDRSDRLRRKLRSVGTTVAFAILLTVPFSWLFARKKPIPIHGRDLVLVAAIENRTGEPILDGTLEFALQRELAESEFVSVVTPLRVQDALQLMHLPPNTTLTSAIAREICLRDGGIRGVLTGRIEKFGQRYLLTLMLINPAGGAATRTWSQEVESQNDLLSAVRQISDRLRRDIGENLLNIDKPAEALEHVTTSSLRAAQLYSQANQLMVRDGPESTEAMDLLQQAISLDPDFASAHNLLAWNLMDTDRPDEALVHFKQAYTLSSASSSRERLFIRASYFDAMRIVMFKGFRSPEVDTESMAIAGYKELLAAYPDDYWALQNLRHYYEYTDKIACAELTARQSDARPNDGGTAEVAAEYFAIIGKADRAAVYAKRALSLLPPDDGGAAYLRMLIKLLPSFPLWQAGRADEADRFLQYEARAWDYLSKDERDAFATLTGNIYLELGMLSKAAFWFERLSQPSERATGALLVAYYRGDRTGMEITARSLSSQQFDRHSALLFENAGLRVRANEVYLALARRFARHRKKFSEFNCLELLGNPARLTTKQLANFECTVGWPPDLALFAATIVADELDRRGDFENAINILKPQTVMLLDVEHPGVGIAPLMVLARIYRRAGLNADADALEASLRKQLAFADQDHLVARQLHIAPRVLPVQSE